MLPAAQAIAENLQKLASADSLAQPELAKRMGISAKTFWTLKEGTGNPTLENLEKASAYLKRPLWQLLIKDGYKLPRDFDPFTLPVPKIEDGHVRIALLSALPSPGFSGETMDYAAVLGHIDVAEAWAKKRLGHNLDDMRVLPVAGDSMSPTINEGDLAFVDTSCTRFEVEGIYVTVFCNSLLIKRLSADFATHRIKIQSDNALHSAQSAHKDDLTICGRVKAWLAVKSS